MIIINTITIPKENTNMVRKSKPIALMSVLALMGAVLLGCGNNDKTKEEQPATPAAETTAAPSETAAASATPQEAATTRAFADWTKHEVVVPVTPQRVIYHGETTGDLLALGVKPIGIMKDAVKGTVMEDQLSAAEDVGFPLNLEKALSLKPDLIIFSNSDEEQYQAIAKVGPTVTFNTFDGLEARMRTLGDLLNKKQEAEDWLSAHANRMAGMWKELRANGMKEDETASVFTMYPGDRLFIMAGAGLPQFLYEEDGFKPLPSVQELIDQETGFLEISAELLPQYAGDRIFILDPVDPAARKSTEDLTKSGIWSKLPAVRNGQVYSFDILKAGSDATSRDWLIDELPKALLKK